MKAAKESHVSEAVSVRCTQGHFVSLKIAK